MPSRALPAGARTATRTPAAIWAGIGVGLVAYGLSSILIRAAGPAEPLAIAAWRTLFVALLLVPAAAWTAGAEIRALDARAWRLIGASGVLLGLHFVIWIASVQLTSVAAAAVLVTTSPLWIAVLGALGLGTRPDGRALVAVAVGIAGAALIGLSEATSAATPPTASLGNGMALVAAILVAGYFLVGGSVRSHTSFLAFFAPVNAIAAATAFGVCVVTGTPVGLPAETLAWCVAMAIGPGLVGHGAFALALGYVAPPTLSLLTLAEPVIATLLAVVLFAEVPGTGAVAGMVLVLASIGAVVWRS